MSWAKPTNPVVTTPWHRLFDVTQLSHLLAEDADTRACLGEPPYQMNLVRYWPQGSPQIRALQVEWSLRTSSGAIHALFGQQCLDCKPSRSLPQQHSASAKGEGCVGSGSGVSWNSADGQLGIHSPERDGTLTQLATCLSAQAMELRLNAFGFHAADGAGKLTCRLAGYRANRRAAIRYCFESRIPTGTGLLGKTFRDMRGRELIRRHMLVSAALRKICGTRVRVPAPVGFDPDLQLAVFFWMNGTSLESIPRGHDKWMASTVDSLAAIHELSIEGLPVFTPIDEATIVRRWSEAIRHIAPDTHAKVGRIADALSQTAGDIRTKHARTVHRDFYEKQVVVSDDGVTVLDLDTMSIGNPAVDLGNILAHLYLNSVHDPLKAADSARQSTAFLDCWESRCGPVDRKALHFFTASALFRLGAVHAFRSQTGSLAPLLWEAAALIAEGVPHALEALLSGDSSARREVSAPVSSAPPSTRVRSRRLAG